MSEEIRHVHADYHSAFCGLDASHILMTYDPAEANCPVCVMAAEQFDAAEEAVKDDHAQLAEEEARADAERLALEQAEEELARLEAEAVRAAEAERHAPVSDDEEAGE